MSEDHKVHYLDYWRGQACKYDAAAQRDIEAVTAMLQALRDLVVRVRRIELKLGIEGEERK